MGLHNARQAASAPAARQQRATLVSRAAAGDQEAWDQIVDGANHDRKPFRLTG